MTRPPFFYSDALMRYDMGPQHPLRPLRHKMTHDLLQSYGVFENVLQLRGDAGERQVPGEPKTAYTHVYGAPGISGVTILTR